MADVTVSRRRPMANEGLRARAGEENFWGDGLDDIHPSSSRPRAPVLIGIVLATRTRVRARARPNLDSAGRDPIPDETTILNFWHLLEAHELTKTVFEAVAEHLEARGALLRGGTIVDHADRRLAIHQKRGWQARSRDALLEEGQSMVLRHEGAHRASMPRAGLCTRRA